MGVDCNCCVLQTCLVMSLLWYAPVNKEAETACGGHHRCPWWLSWGPGTRYHSLWLVFSASLISFQSHCMLLPPCLSAVHCTQFLEASSFSVFLWSLGHSLFSCLKCHILLCVLGRAHCRVVSNPVDTWRLSQSCWTLLSGKGPWWWLLKWTGCHLEGSTVLAQSVPNPRPLWRLACFFRQLTDLPRCEYCNIPPPAGLLLYPLSRVVWKRPLHLFLPAALSQLVCFLIWF